MELRDLEKGMDASARKILEDAFDDGWRDAARLTCFPRLMEIIRESEDEACVVKAIGMVFDRAYGKPTERLEHTGKDGGDFVIRWFHQNEGDQKNET